MSDTHDLSRALAAAITEIAGERQPARFDYDYETVGYTFVIAADAEEKQ